MMKNRAFTLIELLIVVAIIAILAAIAVPNFLEAQVRAKVARAKTDLRTMTTGLETYRVDYNGYPDIFTRLMVITTPVQYLSQLPRDIFRMQQQTGDQFWRQRTYRYGAMPLDSASRYALASVGPDTDIDTYFNSSGDKDDTNNWEPDNQALRLYPGYSSELFSNSGVTVNSATFRYAMYDPTNGTVSDGDIFRLSDHQLQ
jgi:type II secretion system protein G